MKKSKYPLKVGNKLFRDRDKKLIELGFSSYKEYLKSSHWLEIRKRYFSIFPARCSICNSSTQISLHHLSYETLCEENLIFDLRSVCDNCHKSIHYSHEDPYKGFYMIKNIYDLEGKKGIKKLLNGYKSRQENNKVINKRKRNKISKKRSIRTFSFSELTQEQREQYEI